MENKETNLNRTNSISEPNLNTASDNIRRKSGFPPGTTVDELRYYRKKRSPATYPGDHLCLKEGSFKLLKTEYQRKFRRYAKNELTSVQPIRRDDLLKIEGELEFHPEYNEQFVEFPLEKRHLYGLTDREGLNNKQEILSLSTPILTEIRSETPFVSRRQPLAKRSTNLKLEGELYMQTEQAEKYIEYLLTERPRLMRKPTNLRLEGEMDIKTENREQFVPFEPQPRRPPLCKKFTNLHLEGDLNIVTETQSNFIPYEIQKRPPLTKKNTNLHVEGDLEMMPEYRREFIEYKTERRKLALPVNHLKTDGIFDGGEGKFDQIHPQIPFLRNDDSVGLAAASARRRSQLLAEHKNQFVEKPAQRTERFKINNNLYMEGEIELTPEYRNAYIDFNRNRSTPIRSRRTQQSDQLKISRDKMESTPEYREAYLNFPRERPQMRRPGGTLSSEGEMDHLTENNQKYVPFPNAPRTNSLKREPELKLEGEIECQPEYRKAYINYLIRERPERLPRPSDFFPGPRTRIFDEETNVKTNVTNVQPDIKEESEATTVTAPNINFVAKVTPPTPRAGTPRSLAQIENSVFGPKLATPKPKKKIASRSTTPTPSDQRRSPTPVPSDRRKSQTSKGETPTTDSDVSSSRNKTFGNRVRVENLARTADPSPLPLVDVSKRNRWMRRDSSVESVNTAFLVLDNTPCNKSGPNVSGRRKERWPTWYGDR